MNPPDVLSLENAEDWESLMFSYDREPASPWISCLRLVRANGARCAVVEHGYRDRDYASEHAAFLADSFDPPPIATDRLHFFRRPLTHDDLWNLPAEPGYLGCTVVRHPPLGRVGRTLLAPPDSLAGYSLTTVPHEVTFFGQRLRLDSVPFAQQDSRLGRCSHVAAWICHSTAAARGIVPRRRLAEFAVDVRHELEPGRAFPSGGPIAEGKDAGRVSFITHGLPSITVTAGLAERGYGPAAMAAYRMTRLPEWVWVVEAVDERRREQGQPAVIGEVVFDPTTPDDLPGPLLIRRPGEILRVYPDHRVETFPTPDEAVRSLGGRSWSGGPA